MQRGPSSTDMAWPVVMVFGLMAVFIFGLTHTGDQLRAEMSSSLRSIVDRPVNASAPTRPQVLVLTQNHDDETRIVATVNPRGYQVVVAETASVARAILQSNSNTIEVVVVDTDVAGGGTLATLAQGIVSGAKVIKLRRHHGATDLAVLLLAAI